MKPRLRNPFSGTRESIPPGLLAGVSAYSIAYLTWLAIGGGDRELISDLAFVPIIGIAALESWRAGGRGGSNADLRWGWRLISLGIVSYGFGTLAQLFAEATTDGLISESLSYYLSEAFYFGFYPFFLAGILRFPWGRSGGLERRRLAILDAATIATAGGAVIWYIVLGPTAYANDSGGLLENLVAVAYPVGDIVLIAALSLLWLSARETGLGRPLSLLSAGLGFFIVGDIAYNLVELHSTYEGGSWVDAPWLLSFSLFTFAAASQAAPRASAKQVPESAREIEEREATEERQAAETPIVVAALPYLAVIATVGMLIGTQAGDSFFPGFSLTLTVAVVVALVSVRQYLVQRSLAAANRGLRDAHAELAALATTDPLTGLPNHRGLADGMDRELDRAKRFGRECSLLFIDIDFFKALNDACGHAAGDMVLSELGDAVEHSLRRIDILGRWGGEEFVAVLPEVGPDAATVTAERIRSAIAGHEFAVASGTHITVSVGIASYPADGEGRAELLDAADRAMYAAKRMGRNQAFSANDPVVAALLDEGTASELEERATIGAVDALAMLVDVRDKGTGHHVARVAKLAERAALALGCSPRQARHVYLAAKLHDIGKVAVADSILRKPGRLNPEEWEMMRKHPAIGADVVSRVSRLAELAPTIRSHHERYDGGGYPEGLKGDQIPLEARIVGAVDAFDAMVSDRPYRRSMDLKDARQELRDSAGTQFDPDVVAALDRLIGEDQAAEAA